jgi:hypothetical protein
LNVYRDIVQKHAIGFPVFFDYLLLTSTYSGVLRLSVLNFVALVTYQECVTVVWADPEGFERWGSITVEINLERARQQTIQEVANIIMIVRLTPFSEAVTI